MKQQLKISYWIYPEGDEFEEIDLFKKQISAEYDLEMVSEKTDAMGGGLYELVVELYNNINLEDFLKDYVKDFIEDGIKIGLGYFWRPLFQKIKKLFAKNEKLTPDIELVRFVFRDTAIIIYPLYPNSLSEVIDEVIQKLSEHFFKIKERVDSKITSIHIPIFNQIDFYEICSYRVRLSVDENIPKFFKEDYFKHWGIRCESRNNLVYDLREKKFTQIKFYTQQEYDILFNEWWEKKNNTKA